MSSIDERVVQMKFDNTQFQNGVKTTQSALDNLKKNLNFDGAKKGIEGLQAASKGFSLQGMAAGIDTLVSKFSTLNIVGITALTNIVNKAVNAGTQLAKSLTIDPIKSGFDEYELKMGSIQTILSNTARYGTKLPEVTKNLDALNAYADKTIYNFGDMTKNIGLFTNAGIKVGDATTMIKGFSNEAAASGTSAEGAAGAAYQLSQALSAGKVTLMDWRSLQNVGMGNKNMQKGIVDIASAMGTVEKKGLSSKKIMGDFNGSLEKGWLTADVMSKYLKIMAGDMSEAEMKSMGLSKAQIATFKTQQKNAEEAATKVRTFTQLLGTMRESVGSGWSETFDILVGDFNQATELWTGVNNTLGHIIEGFAKRRNDMLRSFAQWGGRNAIINSLSNAFKALMSIITPITKAFREIFPAKTGRELAIMAMAFEKFTKGLILGKDTANGLKSTFKGLFAIFSIGWSIIKGLVGYFVTFFSVFAGGGGSVLKVTGNIGDLLVKLDTWLKQGDKIGKFFDTLAAARTAILVPIVDVISKIVSAFALLFKGDISGFVNGIKGSFSGLEPIVAAVQGKINHIMTLFQQGAAKVQEFFGNAYGGASSGVVSALGFIQVKVQQLRMWLNLAFGSVRDLFDGLNNKINGAGIEGAAKASSAFSSAGEKARSVWDAVGKAFAKVADIFGPINQALSDVFGSIKDKIVEYIKNLSFEDAVALLNTGFFILLYKTLTSFTKKLSGFVDDFLGIFEGISDTLSQLTDTLKSMQQSVQASIILKIGIAVGVLALAILLLSKIDPEGLKKALIALAVLLAQMAAMMYALSKMNFQAEVAKAATALLLLAIAMSVLATAVQKLSGLSWEQLGKGLVGVGGLLVSLGLFAKFAQTNNGGIKAGAGLILLAVAIRLLANSVEKLGSMDLGTLAKGVGALSIIMLAMAGVVKIINGSTGMVQAAVGLLILSAALAALSVTMRIYAAMDWGTMIKGLGSMAVALTLIGAAMRIMPRNMPSLAAGLLIVSAALIILAGALKIMGGMSWEELAKGLLALTVALAAISIALIAMEASLPGAAALIVASVALGVLAGVLKVLGSMDIESVGIALLAIAGVLAILGIAAAVMIPLAPGMAILATSVQALGIAMLAAGAGFALFAGGFAILATVGTAGVAVLIAAFTGVLNLIPLFMQQIALGLRAFAKVIADSGPLIVNALTTLLLSLLQAIRNVIPPAIATMVEFLLGMLQAIDRVVPQAIATMTRLIIALLEAIRILIPRFISVMGDIIMAMVNKVSSMIPQIADAGMRMIKNFLDAVAKRVPEIVNSAVNLIDKFLKSISDAVPRIVASGMKMITDILNGVAKAIRDNSQEMTNAGMNVASAIVDGMVNGLRDMGGRLISKAKSLAQDALNQFLSIFDINSPSREMYKIGVYVVQGFVKGLDGNKASIDNSFNSLKTMLTNMKAHAKKEIDDLQKKLAKLQKNPKKNSKAIKDTRAELAQARDEYTKSSNALANLTKNWTKSKNDMGALANQYDVVTGKLKTANEKLAEAVKLRDDYSKSVKDQYNNLPEINGTVKLQDFANDLRKKINDTVAMRTKLNTLIGMGLNKTMIEELTAKGTDAIPFMDELIASGKSGVGQINSLGSQLDSAAAKMGVTASTALYQAGVDSARGIVKGLQDQQKNLEKQMDVIAAAMVKSIKKSLGIKSPSREFMKVGKFSAEGLKSGMDQHAKMVEKSATEMGHGAINSLRKSISGLDRIVSDEISKPVVSPVLDLSAVRKDASKIGKMFPGHGISVSAGYTGAKDAAEGYSANLKAIALQAGMVDNRTEVNLTQINNSPRALPAIEIYRNTKNQLSVAKGALTKK